jgi:hypothetical protein
MSQHFGAIRQVGYVVKDIESAMKHWLDIGVGPWFYQEDAGGFEYYYYGKASPIPKMSIAVTHSGEIQIELIQQRNDVPSPYIDTLHRNGECAQHVAYWTTDKYDEFRKHLAGLGYVEVHGGRMAPNRGRFSYYSLGELPSTMIELTELCGSKGEFYESVRQAALSWDGSDPIRMVAAPK